MRWRAVFGCSVIAIAAACGVAETAPSPRADASHALDAAPDPDSAGSAGAANGGTSATIPPDCAGPDGVSDADADAPFVCGPEAVGLLCRPGEVCVDYTGTDPEDFPESACTQYQKWYCITAPCALAARGEPCADSICREFVDEPFWVEAVDDRHVECLGLHTCPP